MVPTSHRRTLLNKEAKSYSSYVCFFWTNKVKSQWWKLLLVPLEGWEPLLLLQCSCTLDFTLKYSKSKLDKRKIFQRDFFFTTPYFFLRPTWPWSPPQAPWCLPWSSRATCPSNRTPRKKCKVLVSKHFPLSTSLWKFVNILFSVPWMKFSTLFCSPHLKAEQMSYQGLFDHRVMESTKEDNNTKACLICFAISHHLNCTVTSL